MKKILLSMLTVMTAFVTAGAQSTDLSTLTDAVYVEAQEAPAGSQQTLSIRMKNSIEVQTIQFDLCLPEGLTVVANEDLELVTASKARINKFSFFQSSKLDDGTLRLLAQATTTNIAVGDGEIATVTVNVAGSMVLGDYPIEVKDIVLVSKDNVSKKTDKVTTMLTVVEALENRVVLDETSATAPTASAGAVDVRVKRTIKANEWSTLVLPFAMTAAQVQAAFNNGDVQLLGLAKFKGWEATEFDAKDNTTAIEVTFEDVEEMAANTPYIIKVSKAITEFTVDGVEIDPEDEPAVTVGRTNKGTFGSFTGSYVPTTIDAECLFLSGNKFWYSTGLTQMKGYRAYFYFQDVVADYYDSAGATTRISMRFDGGVATGIAGVGGSRQETGSTYDLQGRKIAKPIGKGLYIRDGKKIVK